MIFTDAPFSPGEYLEPANGLLGGTEHEGKEFFFLDQLPAQSGERSGKFRYDPAATPSSDPKIAMRVRLLRVVRNVSGVTLPVAGRLCVFGRDAARNITGATVVNHAVGSTRIIGLSRMGAAGSSGPVYCKPGDEFLPSAGVPNNALFFVVMRGPAKIYMPLAALASDLAQGDPICAITAATSAVTNGISNGGRLDKLNAGATTYPAGAWMGVVGAALEAMSSQATTGNVQVLVDVGGYM